LVTTQTEALTPFFAPLEVKLSSKSLDKGLLESNAHIAVAFDVLQSDTKLNNLVESVKSGGFIITSESINVPESAINKSNLVFISKLSVEDTTFYLLRKVN